MICERKDIFNVSSCSIIPEECGNNSDHLPVQQIFTMIMNSTFKQRECSHMQHTGKISPNWSNVIKVENYSKLVTEQIVNIAPICVKSLNYDNIKHTLD